jgi:hypothetical protein
MRAQILNDAAGWDDPGCKELGCGYQAESEPTDPTKIRGNFTHDDTQASAERGYRMTVTIAMANDYNGYIASYREFMNHDHYRKALTAWGSHSSDYYATRLAQMGRALNGDADALRSIEGQTDPAKADPAWAVLVGKEAADQAAEEARVRAVGEAAAQAVKAYAFTLPDDGGADAELVQPTDIERFDSATFTWNGGNNYTDDPVVTVERRKRGRWVRFADQSGEVPVTLEYPSSTPDGIVTYRAGGQVWKWTASFEAFVSRFPLVDPRGREYRATPAGTYRFVVRGRWRKGNRDVDYSRISNSFEVEPWSGITVESAALDDAGHVTFRAGPSHQIDEPRVRRTDRPPLAAGDVPVPFTIGPVDFPDTARDQKATGARFMNDVRGYSAASPAEVEHYCLDCSFRPWLDATGAVVATVVIERADGAVVRERIEPGGDGGFASSAALQAGDRARISIEDAWGDHTARSAVLSR